MVVAILIVIPGVIILVSPIVHALLIVMFIFVINAGPFMPGVARFEQSMSIKTWLLLLFVPVAAGIMLLVLRHPRVGELFHKHISDRPGRRLFLAAIGFFVTFASPGHLPT